MKSIVYCKRSYFRWGEISRKCCQDLSRGDNFHDTSRISFIESYGFYFRVGEIFAKKATSRKTQKLPPHEKFPHLQYFLNMLNMQGKNFCKLWCIVFMVGWLFWGFYVTFAVFQPYRDLESGDHQSL